MSDRSETTTDPQLWAIGLTLLAMVALDASADWWCPPLLRAMGMPQ